MTLPPQKPLAYSFGQGVFGVPTFVAPLVSPARIALLLPTVAEDTENGKAPAGRKEETPGGG